MKSQSHIHPKGLGKNQFLLMPIWLKVLLGVLVVFA